LGWKPVVTVEHYQVSAEALLAVCREGEQT
jgi:hypothetical protein